MNTRRNLGLLALLALLFTACTNGGGEPVGGEDGDAATAADAVAGDGASLDGDLDAGVDGHGVETCPGGCLIDGACFEDGAPNPENDCEICTPDIAQDAWGHAEYGAPCEDGNPCTEMDTCDTGVCFAGSPPSCADGIQCTIDSCDPEEGCSHELNHGDCADDNPCTVDTCDPTAGGCANVADDTLICSDLDVCTLNDRCDDGECVSDAEPLPCDDDNACTDEICHPVFGCVYAFNEEPCNDGASCTQDDVCHWGTCLGVEPWSYSCPPCDVTFSEHVQKLTKISVGSGGWAGEALNIDGDLKTCSPTGDCENGLDNALSFAGEFINDTIQQNIAAEDNTLLFTVELIDPTWDGVPFTMKLYYSYLSPTNADCDFMQETCIYQAGTINFDALCNVQITFDNTTFEDGKLTAGGSGYIFPFQMSFAGGGDAELVLYTARVEGTLTFAEDGSIASMTGVFGGAVTKEDITDLVNAIAAEYFPGGQDMKDMILGMVPLMNNDIDLDGDGTTDGVSIGMVFDSIPGIMAPYYY